MRVHFSEYDGFLNNVIDMLYDYFEKHPEYRNPIFFDDEKYDLSKIKFDNHETVQVGNGTCGSPEEMFEEFIDQLKESDND